MKSDLTAPITRATKPKGLVWTAPIQWLRASLLRFNGWECEGPFPRPAHQALLILGPGLDQGKGLTLLAEHRMNFEAVWIRSNPSEALSEPLPHQNLALIDHKSGHLNAYLDQAAARGISVQLIQAAPSEKRIRCNAPFSPSKFRERDLSYIHRMFSYND